MVRLSVNGVEQTTMGKNIVQLLDELHLQGRSIAVEKNGDIVPRSQFAIEPLADGDRLEIVTAIGGG